MKFPAFGAVRDLDPGGTASHGQCPPFKMLLLQSRVPGDAEHSPGEDRRCLLMLRPLDNQFRFGYAQSADTPSLV